MKWFENWLERFYKKKIDAQGLAVFRIFYSLVLFAEILHLFYFRHLIFDPVPYLQPSEIGFTIPLVIWGIVVLMLMFGVVTRLASIINYLMGLILIGSITTFEYHVFYAYMGLNFLLMFLPVSKVMSLDRLFLKLKYSNTTFQYHPPRTVRQIYYLIPVLLGLGLVYFDSTFYKVASHMWSSGLGVWMPSSLPMITTFNYSYILDQEWLVKFLGYLTFAFEATFIFVFFRKKWRIWLLFIGLFLHLGILFTFPIPWFALTACAIYTLMVPVGWWKRLFNRVEKEPKLKVYIDAECPLCVRTKLTVSHLDTHNKIAFRTVQFDSPSESALNGIDNDTLLMDIHSVDRSGRAYAGVDTYIQIFRYIWYLWPISMILRLPGFSHLAKFCYAYVADNRTTKRCTEDNCGYDPPVIPQNTESLKLLQNLTLGHLKFKLTVGAIFLALLFQLIIIYNSAGFEVVKGQTGFNKTKVDHWLSKAASGINVVTRTFFGITNHAVFTDNVHFDKYNHIIAVVYEGDDGTQEWLPIIDENGQPSYYAFSANWVKWTFRVNCMNVDQDRLIAGIRDFSAFWAVKNGISLEKARFKILVKKIDSPNGWEKGFLNEQMQSPWIPAGTVKWFNKSFIADIETIENL